MKMNEIYEAPAVEVLKVMVETGFAGSLGSEGDFGEAGGGEL